MVRIAILGAGNIAGIMAETLNGMKAAGNDRFFMYAVAARDKKRAEAFAHAYGFEKFYGSYEEMVQDDRVDLVYIATPHSHHADHIRLCLEHGKHVLCEKSFTVNAKQAREVLHMAEEKKLLLTEAIWTRYMPMRKMIREEIDSGIIGRTCMLTANLGYSIAGKERLKKPELAGGALLDVGVYPLNFAVMAFGDDIEGIDSSVQLTDLGVDAQESITFRYRDGRMAVLNATMTGMSDRKGIIYGDKGYMEIENINNPQKITVYGSDREIVKEIACPEQITGYEYEVESCIEALEKGWIECPQMPHEETIRMMEMMDGLRKSWGITYPGE
ncbi:Gfo/Idh/MocA family oxidoreductase [Clostridium sp. AM58-1XD]|uniref:Gfo/Idh/MocA family protein n=1 Tax=Clostridium sp. AM58-1XD TaxID=2292307 RepID=UPI000E4DEF8B|nr:Gfo/Idh/MocA family oxidoreductase [Clostridium sp. AM58-1XD]RGY97493.1 gfo/Idh/MocA family oxidoreductase [Clostridium sp. AM58-1XD]